MIPVILSGGSGTRLWPLSRKKLPKQFAEIFDSSLQEMTFERCRKIGKPVLITGIPLKTLTEQLLQKMKLEDTQVVYEPMGKNTAPAVAVLCQMLSNQGHGDKVVGVFPSDHLVTKVDRFLKVTEFAETIVKQNKVVTLGVEPSYPETGYGYIQTQTGVLGELNGFRANTVQKFHEKPNIEMAKKFLAAGNYFWNAGIFVFQVSHMLNLFKQKQPEIYSIAANLKSDLSNLDQIYSQMPSQSIDYAIMEKLDSSELACIPCDLGWSDVGSWDAVAQHYERHGENQRGVVNKIISVQSNNNFVFGVKDRSYSFVGVDDSILVDTQDAILVVKKGQSQMVKDVVDELNKDQSKLTQEHIFEHRPWGNYEILRDTNIFKSKVIQVNPYQQLSYQSHAKREEHWIITRGKGEVVLNDQAIPVKTGSHVHIPVGAKHRMRNTGAEMLEFVEVQLGTYFGEDDIIRYQDDYKRI